MSPENDTPQHNDEAPAKATIAKAVNDHLSVLGGNPVGNLLAGHILEALKAAGFEITKGHGITGEVKFERNEQPYVNLELPGGQRVTGWVDNRIEGVTVGDGLWFPNPDDLTDTARTVVDLEGSAMGRSLPERLGSPGPDAASVAAQTGMELANRTAAYGSLGPDEALKMALDVIGRRTDIVAIQLPEPDEGVWYINEHGGNVHPGLVGQLLVDNGAILWGINTDEARTLAAALLAAAARADAAEGEAK